MNQDINFNDMDSWFNQHVNREDQDRFGQHISQMYQFFTNARAESIEDYAQVDMRSEVLPAINQVNFRSVMAGYGDAFNSHIETILVSLVDFYRRRFCEWCLWEQSWWYHFSTCKQSDEPEHGGLQLKTPGGNKEGEVIFQCLKSSSTITPIHVNRSLRNWWDVFGAFKSPLAWALPSFQQKWKGNQSNLMN